MPVFRADLHNHCNCDPIDHLDYSPQELTDTLQANGIDVFAITPHRDVFHNPDAEAYARHRGMLLIPGVEKMIEGKEVLLLNVQPEDIPARMTFKDLAKLRSHKGDDLLVIAPHPFYPRPNCMGALLDEHIDLFDAVEFAHLYGFGWNPNTQAQSWAAANNKALLANSDSHAISMAGRHHTEIYADELSCASIFSSIRARKTRVISSPLSPESFTSFALGVVLYQEVRRIFSGRGKNTNY